MSFNFNKFVFLFYLLSFHFLCSAFAYDNLRTYNSHAISLYSIDDIKYKEGFANFDYANPKAKKKGMLKLSALGNGFNDFNPFNVKGEEPAGVSLMYDTLMKSSSDEASVEYALIAERVMWDDSKTWVAYKINPNAKFSDGVKITNDDIEFSFNILLKEGNPFYSSYYGAVKKVEKVSDDYVKFVFSEAIPELPLIIGQMPILPKHYWKNRDFKATGLDIPVVSGPYVIDSFDPVKFITYKRNDNYWGKNEPVNIGFYNFDKIRYDYYRDNTVALEAFKAGEFDIRLEQEAKKWVNSYNKNDNRIVMKLFHHNQPSGMQGFVFNTSRDVFKNINVRKAIAMVFDFNWANQKLFYGQYQRAYSFFDNSILSSVGDNFSDKEWNILQNYRYGKKTLPKQFFDYFKDNKDGVVEYLKPYQNIRDNFKKALQILYDEGFVIDDKTKMLKDKNTGEFIKFEILIDAASASMWERVILPFIQNLRRIGIDASLRSVESNIYKTKLDTFDYDMIVTVFVQSLSPGNEQWSYFGSKYAGVKGANNLAFVKDDVVDDLIFKIVSAKTYDELVSYVRVYDRVLLWNCFVIPHWYVPYHRIAYWDKFDFVPDDVVKTNGPDFMTWWFK